MFILSAPNQLIIKFAMKIAASVHIMMMRPQLRSTIRANSLLNQSQSPQHKFELAHFSRFDLIIYKACGIAEYYYSLTVIFDYA